MKTLFLLLLLCPLITIAQQPIKLKDSTTIFVYDLTKCDNFYYFRPNDAHEIFKIDTSMVISNVHLGKTKCMTTDESMYTFFKREHTGFNLMLLGGATFLAGSLISAQEEDTNFAPAFFIVGGGISLSGLIVSRTGYNLARHAFIRDHAKYYK